MPVHPGLMGEFDTPRATHLAEAFPPFPPPLAIFVHGFLSQVQGKDPCPRPDRSGIGAIIEIRCTLSPPRWNLRSGLVYPNEGRWEGGYCCGESISRDRMDRPRSGLTHFNG